MHIWNMRPNKMIYMKIRDIYGRNKIKQNGRDQCCQIKVFFWYGLQLKV